jgi:hypothetical protein
VRCRKCVKFFSKFTSTSDYAERLPPQPKFSPRITRMNANRKESLLDFAKLWECDAAPCRSGLNQAWKAVRGLPHSKSTSGETLS